MHPKCWIKKLTFRGAFYSMAKYKKSHRVRYKNEKLSYNKSINKRKQYSANFQIKVVLESLTGEIERDMKTIEDISSSTEICSKQHLANQGFKIGYCRE